MPALHRLFVLLAVAATSLMLGSAALVLSTSPAARAADPPGTDQPTKPLPTFAPPPSATPTPWPTPTAKPGGPAPPPTPTATPSPAPTPTAKPVSTPTLPTPSPSAAPTVTPKPNPGLPDLTIVQTCLPPVGFGRVDCTVTITNRSTTAAAIVPQNALLVEHTFYRADYFGLTGAGWATPSGYECTWDLMDWLTRWCRWTAPTSDVIGPGESRVFSFGAHSDVHYPPPQTQYIEAEVNPYCSYNPQLAIAEINCGNNRHTTSVIISPY